METDKTTIRDGLHRSRCVRLQREFRPRLAGAKDHAKREVQNTIDQLTADGNTRFTGCWNLGCLLVRREAGKHRVYVFNHQPKRGVRK